MNVLTSRLPASPVRSRYTAWSVLLLVAALVAAVAAPPAAGAEEGPFTDSAEAGVHRPAVDALGEWGYFEGTECDTDTFCPDDPIERWVMAVWLVRALGYHPLRSDTSRFADVPVDEWWSPYTERLVRLGVTSGCKTDPLRYCPDRAVNRAQMAAFLARALHLQAASPMGFIDTEGSVHASSIDALAAAGITSGCKTEPLSYCPDKPVTRAQMATFLYRAIGGSQRAILAALFHATGGYQWHQRTNWLGSAPIRDWHGVFTDRSGRIIALQLASNGLRGTIPAVLGNLKELDTLSLDGNGLKGPIPPELGDLAVLRILTLSQNQLSGSLPAEIGGMRNLEDLRLGDNQIEGRIPSRLVNLTSLQIMEMPRNRFEGPIPKWLGRLASLETLNLGDNWLSGRIPTELGNLTSLSVLELVNNDLRGPIPAELGNLSFLHHLNLSWNALTGPVPVELGELPVLESLYLGGNRLSGCIPEWVTNVEHSDHEVWHLPSCN